VRIIIAATTGLGTGESYYFRGAHDIALSYVDQPPLFFWLSHVSLKIFGTNTFGLRLPDVMLFSGTSFILYLIAKWFFSEKAGFYTVLIFNLSALYIIDGIWFQPDAPLLFFWSVGLYIMVRLFFPKAPLTCKNELYLWILLGVDMGLTGLSKYHVVFFALGVLLYIITRERRVFKNSGFYLAGVVCLIFFLPIFIWNYQHDWVSIRFQSSREFTDNFHLHFDWFFRSFLGQALWLLPWIWVPIVVEFVRSYRLGKTDNKYWFFFCMALFPIVFFTASTLWADLSYHFHWQSVGYMILFVPLGAMVEKRLNSPTRGRTLKWIVFSFVFAYGILFLAGVQEETGFWQSYGPKQLAEVTNPGTPKDQIVEPTMDGYDYTDLLTYFETHGLLNQPNLFVGASHWLISGKVDWALKGKIPVRSFEEQRNYSYYFNDNDYLGQDLIFVTRDNTDKVLEDTHNYCSNLRKVDDVPITRHGRTEMVLHLYKCDNFHSFPVN
jgi:hypothetical protein